MPTDKLQKLFDIVKKRSEELNKRHHNFDGQAFWGPIKHELIELDRYTASKWKSLGKKITSDIMSLSEYTKDGYGRETIIKSHHFLIQQVRIPLNEQPNVRKIIQIALNIGQWYGKHDTILMKKIKYPTLHLNQLSRYISQKDVKKLSKIIPDHTIETIMHYLSSKR